MKRQISCEFKMDTACAELKFSDGSLFSIDTITVEYEAAENMYQGSELEMVSFLKFESGYLALTF